MERCQRIRLGDNNLYAVRTGGEHVLVDAGPDYRGAWEALQEALPGRPERVIVTHGHLDHAGLAGRWQQAGVPVLLHARDLHLATHPQLSHPAEFDAMRRYAEETGAPAGVVAAAVAALAQRREWAARAAVDETYPSGGNNRRWPTGLRYRPFEPSTVFGGDMDVGDLEILHCPGHTPGNAVVVHGRNGWLFSGDQLLPGFTPTPAIQLAPEPDGGGDAWRFHSLPAFVASMRRIATLRLERCFPGHGEPFDDVTAAIEANLAAIERRSARALADLRRLGRATVYALAMVMYPRALERRFWQIIATVQGHLDLLQRDGAVREVDGSYEPV
ncbi:MAG: hypothetical protein Kow0010_02330 [Dehalococcoidia bacterium]